MLRMGTRAMQEKQLRIYGAKIRLNWFIEAKKLDSVREACKRLGIPKSTYYYWWNKWQKGGRTLESLMDEPRTPHSHPSDPDEETVSLIVQLRLGLMYGEQKIAFVAGRDYGLKISVHGVHNILSRAGLLEKRKKKVRKQGKLNDYPYQPGELMQMDVKHWKRTGYQYDIIDCCTRIKFKMIFKTYNVHMTVKFLELAEKFYAPAFKMQAVQMDNGSEFTNNKLFRDGRRPARLALPEKWLRDHGIKIVHIPPSSPNLNGRIERPHGVDKWRYNRMTSASHQIDELREFAIDDCLDYNTYRPHEMLNNMTPIEFLQNIEGYENACPDFSVIYEICYN